MIKFSIVVPVYNAEKHLRNCLDSILHQTYKYYEVIMVVDGCMDCSEDICKVYADGDSRFHLYRKENGGSGSARNYGLQYVTGQYVCFVDSDDMIQNNLLEIVYGKIKMADAQVYIFNYHVRIDKEISVFCPDMKEEIYTFDTPKEKFRLLMNLLYFEYAFSVWNKVYRADVIQNNDLTFPEDVTVGEDLCFNMKYFLYCSKISVISQKLYFYNVHEDSIMNHGEKAIPCLDDSVLFLKDVSEYYKRNAPRYIRRHFSILIYEGMNNQYYKYSHQTVINSIRNMCYKGLQRKYTIYVLAHFILFIHYYGIRQAAKIMKKNVRYLFER